MTTRLLSIALLLSGYAALTYEMAWTRQLVSLFGVTYHAITTILVTFMGGLALGSWLAGRRGGTLASLPPLVAFAALEVVLAIYAQAFPHLLGTVEGAYLSLARGGADALGADTALRFFFGSLVLLPPAVVSGATLPIAARAGVADPGVTGSRGIGSPSEHAGGADGLRGMLAALYGANVAGAMLGCVSTTFFTVGLLGYPGTAWLGSSANLAAAALAIAALRHERALRGPSGAPEARDDGAAASMRPSRVAVAYGIAGAATMGIEILWTRVLSQAGWNAATYVFGLVLGTYLLGHAAGSGLLTRVLDRRGARADLLVPRLLAAMGLLTLFSVMLLLPRTPPERWTHVAALRHLALTLPIERVALLVPAVLLPAACSGALFPLAAQLVVRDRAGVARGVGDLSAAATVGGIVGALVVGFWAMPALGTMATLVVIGGALLVASVQVGAALTQASPPSAADGSLVRQATRPTLALAAATLLGAWLVPPHAHLVTAASERLLAFSEGRNSSTAVLQLDATERQLLVHGERLQTKGGGTDVNMAADVHGATSLDAAIIGFGTGRVVLNALKDRRFSYVTAIDFNGDLLAMAPLVRGEQDAAYYTDTTRFRFVDNDGRHFLLLEETEFDVLVNDAALYAWYLELSTLEFSRLARSRLKPEGLYLGRLHLFRITDDAYRREVATFLEVFPNAAACLLSADVLMLIGRNGDRPIQRPPTCGHRAEDWKDTAALRALAGGPVITDAYPLHLPDVFRLQDAYPTAATGFFDPNAEPAGTGGSGVNGPRGIQGPGPGMAPPRGPAPPR